MYSQDDEKGLFKQAKHLLRNENIESHEAISQLRNIIRYCDWKYYLHSESVLSDEEYDLLFKKLKRLESDNPDVITMDSPTQRISSVVSERFKTASHIVPMLSLENTYNAEDLRNWDRRCQELTENQSVEYCIEPKYDGASISLVYENDRLIRAVTRGDGVTGENVTVNVRQIRTIPLLATFSKYNLQEVEIRGEVVIHKEVFKKYNDSRIAEGLAPLANPRNAASGTLRILDPKEVRKRKLSAVLYNVSYIEFGENREPPQELLTHKGTIEWLSKLGFPVPYNEVKIFASILDVISYCSEFEARRDELPFEIDGLVIKVNSLKLQTQMGMTSHHPRWAVAYKFKARSVISRLLKVEFQVGRTGIIAPVAKIAPVHVGGVMVSSVSLFNENFIKEKDIRIGDSVLVERSGDVIPYIVGPEIIHRKGDESEIIFPSHCPACNSALERQPEEAAWRCINISCPVQVVERMIHFASKDAMDIRSLGDANVRKFYELGLLPDIPGIYHIDWERVKQLGGFGAKSVANLQQAIAQSKQQPLNRVIFGLGIRYVGETTAKTLANAVTHIRDFYEWDVEKLSTLQDVGPKVATSVADFFARPENREMIDRLDSAGVNLVNAHKEMAADGALAGKTFLFTGTLNKMKRSDAEAMVEEKGGSILGGVSSKLNYLVVGEDAGSKLEKAKKLGTVSILTEDEFLQMINTTA